jgi:hypothetical protein
MPPWKAGTTASKSKLFMANASRPVPRPSSRCSNILKCIIIANGFIQDRAISAQKLLKLKKSLSRVSLKSGQDQHSLVRKNVLYFNLPTISPKLTSLSALNPFSHCALSLPNITIIVEPMLKRPISSPFLRVMGLWS